MDKLTKSTRTLVLASPILRIVEAIATISNQLETERNHRNSPTELMFGILNSIILLGLLAAFLSFPATWVCNALSSHSQACQSFRVIPGAISRFFSEPK